MQIILASQSPRRQELLKGLHIPFTVKNIEVEEHYPEHLQAEEIPLYLAELKAKAYIAACDSNTLIITADTIVWLQNRVLGKPKDIEEAKAMLRTLSGKTHTVYTGVCLYTQAKQRSFAVATQVRFAQLSEADIEHYVEQYQPLDKAGAYGIQEWIGYIGVEHINGSYFNVMGLPVQRLYRELKRFGALAQPQKR